jgi:cytochrome c553
MKSLPLFIAILLLVAPIYNAQAERQATDKITIELEFVPDLDDGRKTFGVCARCHLPEAWGHPDGTYPQLAGQHVNVLMKQLLDIRNGTRQSSLMYPFVQQRTIGGYQDLANVVAYISTLPMNPDHNKGPWKKNTKEYNDGKGIYQEHCASCHGDNGEGNNELAYPRLHGQHYQYMIQQLKRVKNGLRTVNPAMTSVIEHLDFDQVEKAINYVSHLPVPESDLAESPNWRNPDFQ